MARRTEHENGRNALGWPVNSCEFAATQEIKFIFAAWPWLVAIRRLNLPGIAIFYLDADPARVANNTNHEYLETDSYCICGNVFSHA
jgi:hypothetical protein